MSRASVCPKAQGTWPLSSSVPTLTFQGPPTIIRPSQPERHIKLRLFIPSPLISCKGPPDDKRSLSVIPELQVAVHPPLFNHTTTTTPPPPNPPKWQPAASPPKKSPFSTRMTTPLPARRHPVKNHTPAQRYPCTSSSSPPVPLQPPPQTNNTTPPQSRHRKTPRLHLCHDRAAHRVVFRLCG